MKESRYVIKDENFGIIASDLTMEIALILIEALLYKWYDEPTLALNIEKMEN